jgi:maltose O-acetyltransferase
MHSRGLDRKQSHPLQEFFGALPSWKPIRRLHAAYCRHLLEACGDDLDLSRDVLFEFPQRISIGSRVYINRGTIITARARIAIGDDVLIGPYVVINSGNHGYKDLTRPMNVQDHVSAPINIGNDVWIGAHAVVLSGVTIGDGSVIGAGSVVTRAIPANVVAAGVPARVIASREKSP